jgi:histidine triad (HIT) family protein
VSEPCLFCRIVRGDIPATVVYRTPTVVAIRDIGPQAPTHVLVIPTEHVESLNDAADGSFLGDLLLAAREVAKLERIETRGYRVVVNTNAEAGQSVPHLHLHVLGGRVMEWPPG